MPRWITFYCELTLHGRRRDHALFVMGQLYALDKERGEGRNCAQCCGCYEPRRSPLGLEYLSRHCVTILQLVIFPFALCTRACVKQGTTRHITMQEKTFHPFRACSQTKLLFISWTLYVRWLTVCEYPAEMKSINCNESWGCCSRLEWDGAAELGGAAAELVGDTAAD